MSSRGVRDVWYRIGLTGTVLNLLRRHVNTGNTLTGLNGTHMYTGIAQDRIFWDIMYRVQN